MTPEQVQSWARHTHGSALYARLAGVIADSPELMRVLNQIPNRPRPNVLLAVVHYLLMDGLGPELARFYPSLTDEPLHPEGVGPFFTEFVLDNEPVIVALAATRYTQTNECRRCVALLPAIWASGFDRFHLIDIGTSAGLNLAVDRYRYRWDGLQWGPVAGVTLETELRGRPPNPRAIEVLTRTGLDLKPVDPTDQRERRWLDALIWPEHSERRARLRAALDVVSSVDTRLVAGSATETLGPTLDTLPPGEPAVVMHSFVFNQLTGGQREVVSSLLAKAGERRPLHRVSFELLDDNDEWARLGVDDGSGLVEIGQGHPHGEWLELYALP